MIQKNSQIMILKSDIQCSNIYYYTFFMKNQCQISNNNNSNDINKQFQLKIHRSEQDSQIQQILSPFVLIQQQTIYICDKSIEDLQKTSVQHLCVVIFNSSLFFEVASCLEFDSQQKQQFKKHPLVMFKSKVPKLARAHFIIIQVPQQTIEKQSTPESTLNFIEKMVCLADQIVLVNLNSNLENIVEKNYLQMLDYSYRFQNTKRLSLSIVNRSHKKDSVSKEGIKYTQQLSSSSFSKTTYFQNYPLSADKIIQLIKSKQSNKNAKMTHIKFTLQKYLKLQAIKGKVKYANQLLFESGKQKKEVQRQINLMKLPNKMYDHLMWKSNQLKLYRGILRQSKQNIFEEFNSITFRQVSVEIAKSRIEVFGRKWMKNSFLELKEYFNKIANRRDLKTIKRFNQQCELCENHLSYLIQNICSGQGRLQKQIKILQGFREETREFIKYHNEAIIGEFMSSWIYYKEQAKYLWRNDKRVYQRTMVLLLIVLLAAMQGDVIVGLTVLSVGITFLAIRI